MHHAVPLESEAVAAACELADVADRATADHLGQLEDLGDGQDRALGCGLASRSPHAARVSRQDLVFLHCCHEDRTKEPVRLGRHRRRHAVGQETGPPFAYGLRAHLPDRHITEVRRDVLGQQPAVEVKRFVRAGPGAA